MNPELIRLPLVAAFLLGSCTAPDAPTLDNPLDTGGDVTIFPPLNLRVTTSGAQLITITWDVTTAYATGFIVERSVESNPFEQVAVISNVNVRSYADANVDNRFVYTYRVRCVGSETVSGPSRGLSLRFGVGAIGQHAQLIGLAGTVSNVAFSEFGDYVAAADDLGVIRQWYVPGGGSTVGGPLSTGSAVFDLKYIPNDLLVFSTADSTIRFSVGQIKTPSLPGEIDVNPNGQALACGFSDGKIRFYDISSRLPIDSLNAHAAPVVSLAYSPDGALIASLGANGTIGVWNAVSKALVFSGPGFSGTSISFSGTSTIALLDAVSGMITFLNATTFAVESSLSTQMSTTNAFVIGADNSIVVAAGAGPNWRVWEALGQREVPLSPTTTSTFFSVAISPSSELTVFGGPLGFIEVWNLRTRWNSLSD